jgi:hypothetical protein
MRSERLHPNPLGSTRRNTSRERRTKAGGLRQQGERCMQIARLMSNRQQAKALRKQAEKFFDRAEEIEKAETTTTSHA